MRADDAEMEKKIKFENILTYNKLNSNNKP
jgi:hypothetical protein